MAYWYLKGPHPTDPKNLVLWPVEIPPPHIERADWPIDRKIWAKMDKSAELRIRCTLLKSTRKKGEGGWTLNQKLALLQLVEPKERFSKEIIRDLQMKTKWSYGRVWRGIIFGCSFIGWIVAGWHHSQLEVGGEKVESNHNRFDKQTEWSCPTGWHRVKLEVGGEYIELSQNWLEIQTEWSCPTPSPIENVGVTWNDTLKERESRQVEYWNVVIF